MNREANERIKKILAILAVVIIVAMIGQMVSVMSYNHKDHSVEGRNDKRATYMDLSDRADSTSSWLKRDFELNGEKVDLTGQTFDGTLYNNAAHSVSDWTMRININGDCFVNNAWCGTAEIHQFVGTGKEKVQTLDLRNYKLSDVELEHQYDGDLLIPLTKGDYIIYYPSEKDDEYPLGAHSQLTMGMIFYYYGDIDLSDYTVDFHYYKSYFEGAGFYAIVALIVLFIALLFAQLIADYTYRRAWKEMEIRKSGMSYLSVIYDVIYIVDLVNDELTPMHEDHDPARNVAVGEGAIAKLRELFRPDISDEYLQICDDFMDPDTLQERFVKDSIACEYMSRENGWCLIRLFAIDREPGDPVRRFIFTIQNINDEKIEMERIEADLAEDEPDRTEIYCEAAPYSIREVVDKALEDTKEAAAGSGVELSSDVSPGIPDKLIGDRGKMLMAVSCMLLDAVRQTDSGSIKLSVFGKASDGSEHLLVSVKDTGSGSGEAMPVSGLGINIASEILSVMGSELKMIREESSGSELYFEIDQEIA